MYKTCTAVLLTSLAVASVAAVPSVAHASLISIGVSTGSGTTTLATDGGLGIVSTSGTSGNFAMTASAAGAPVLPQPTLDTSTINVSSSGGGTLYMFITEQGLTSPNGINSFLSSFTVNSFTGLVSSVTEETFISTSNALYSGTLLSSVTDTSGLLSTALLGTSPLLGPIFSETIEYIITTTGIGSTNDTVNLSLPVPEPATFGIFGASLGLMALILRRRRVS